MRCHSSCQSHCKCLHMVILSTCALRVWRRPKATRRCISPFAATKSISSAPSQRSRASTLPSPTRYVRGCLQRQSRLRVLHARAVDTLYICRWRPFYVCVGGRHTNVPNEVESRSDVPRERTCHTAFSIELRRNLYRASTLRAPTCAFGRNLCVEHTLNVQNSCILSTLR